MGQYFKKNKMYKDEVEILSSEEKKAIIAIKECTLLDLNNGENFILNSILNFINGKPLKTCDGTVVNLFNLPERTNDPLENRNNIINYFTEVCEEESKDVKFTKIFDSAISYNSIDQLVNGLQKERNERLHTTKGIKDAIELMNMEMDSTNSKFTKFKAFIDYKHEHMLRNQADKKPKWYQFSKRYNLWKESKTLQKFEDKLVAEGVTKDMIERAAKGETFNQTKFNSCLASNPRDRVAKYKDIVRNEIDKLPEEITIGALSEKGMNFLKVSSQAYRELKELHDQNKPKNSYEKEHYQKEEEFLSSIKTNVKNNLQIDDKLLNDAFKNGFDKAIQDYRNKNSKILMDLEQEFGDHIPDSLVDTFGDDAIDRLYEKDADEMTMDN